MEMPPAGVCGLRAGAGRGEGPAPHGWEGSGTPRLPILNSLQSLPYVVLEDLAMFYFILNVIWKS